MKTIRIFGLALATATALAAITPGATALGQEFDETETETTTTARESWYPAPVRRAEPPTIAQEKAMQRGAQRMARLDAMRWYGMSGSRPTASGMPFTTMYAPAWQQPGGRPFAWYTSARPIVIYANPTVVR